MSKEFNFQAALKALQSGQDIDDKDGILTPLIKQLTEAALQAELDQHLTDDPVPNRKKAVHARPSRARPVTLSSTRHVIALVTSSRRSLKNISVF